MHRHTPSCKLIVHALLRGDWRAHPTIDYFAMWPQLCRVCTCVAMCPFELAKVQLQVNQGATGVSAVAFVQRTYKQGGMGEQTRDDQKNTSQACCLLQPALSTSTMLLDSWAS